MAGSLSHIVNYDGTYTNALIENMHDADGAMQECHQIIAELLEIMSLGECPGVSFSEKANVLKLACTRLGFPVVTDGRTGFFINPVIQPELHGAESVYKNDADRRWLVWDGTIGQWLGRKVKPGDPVDTHISTHNIAAAYRCTEAEALEWEALDARYVMVSLPEKL